MFRTVAMAFAMLMVVGCGVGVNEVAPASREDAMMSQCARSCFEDPRYEGCMTTTCADAYQACLRRCK